jgi:hypothetical protein
MHIPVRILCVLSLLVFGTLMSVAPTVGDDPIAKGETEAPMAVEPGIEVQARGPVHEAFAQPVDVKPEPGPVVPKSPPPLVPEQPPEQRPEGNDVQWIPGYWAWDAERNDFLWISGTYRNVPPGRQYIAGYWAQTDDGWRWVPGFWSSTQQSEIPYAPEPPAPLETEPSLPGPDDDSFYIPGTWVYRDTRFLWRPGYWAAYRPGRVWVHSRWLWTPGGCVFVDGYWDYPLEDRGLLFAPVCFTQPLWHRAGWYYRPTFTVGIGPFFGSFFVRPSHCHYYFGDYFGPRYAGLGYSPWFGRSRWDPLWSYYRWDHRHRGDHGWHDRHRQLYADRAAGRAFPPPRTFAQQDLLVRQNLKGGKSVNNLQLVTPLNQVKDSNFRLARLDAQQVAAQRDRADKVRDLGKTRQKFESAITAAPKSQPFGSPAREVRALKLPGSAQAVTGPREGGPGSRFQDSGKAGKGPIQGSTPSVPRVSSGGKETATPPKTAPSSPGSSIGKKGLDPPRTIPSPGPSGGPPAGKSTPREAKPSAPSLPRLTPPASTPRISSPPPSQPRVTPPSSAPRITAPPRSSSPPPSAPRIASPPPQAPRISSPPPSAPRISPPSKAPRMSSPPSSGPRFSPPSRPSGPRISAPSSRGGGPAPSRGGGPKGGGGGKRGKR